MIILESVRLVGCGRNAFAYRTHDTEPLNQVITPGMGMLMQPTYHT